MIPVYSIVVATFNKKEYLAACLHSLSLLNYPKENYEVLVVDDGSTDGTREFLEGYRAAYQLKCLHGPNHGLAGARNRGIDAAHGQLLMMLDNDCLPHPECLNQIAKAFSESPGRMYVSDIQHIDITTVPEALAFAQEGKSYFPVPHKWLADVDKEALLPLLLKRVKQNFAQLVVGWFGAQGPSVCMEASLFRDLSGYDDRISTYGMEDFDLAFRFVRNEGTLAYVPTSVIYHLDHGHPLNRLLQDSTASLHYFCEKHKNELEVKPFTRFLMGTITFAQFNNAVAQSKRLPEYRGSALDLNFSVFKMVKQRDSQYLKQSALARPTRAAKNLAMDLVLKQVRASLSADCCEALEPMESMWRKNVVLVSPHMDDEVIGCGGCIQRLRQGECAVTIIFVTTGPGFTKARDDKETHAITEQRICESQRVAEYLGASKVIHLHLPERSLAHHSDCSLLAGVLEEHRCDVILTVGPYEFHPDHRAAWKLVEDALPRLTYKPDVYQYEVWGSCRPNRLLSLKESEWDRKQNALGVYKTQLEQMDYMEIMDILGQERGRSVRGEGIARAEAFRKLEVP